MKATHPVPADMLTVEELAHAGADPRRAFPELDPRTLHAYAIAAASAGREASRTDVAVGLPGWHTQFEATFARAVRDGTAAPDVPKEAALAEAFAPLVTPASRDIIDRLKASSLVLDERAVARDIEHAMYAKLFAMSSRALILELAAAQSTGLLQGETAQDRFHYFCSCLRDPAFAHAILSQYPVLVRQATLAVGAWREALVEFALRLSRDAGQIAPRFFSAATIGRLSHLRLSAGDSHRGGRSVVIAEFDHGAQAIVYKPRPLHVDRCFADLVAWLVERGLTLGLRVPAVLEKPGYGWVEHIRPAPCTSADEIARFYRRQGANVALLYFLKGTDLHSENIIAAGSHPVLIDLEALFHPTFSAPSSGMAHEVVQRLIDSSALATGILPVRAPRATPESEWLDMSGMSGADAREIPFELPVWTDVDTDNMRMRLERTTLDPDDNLPVLDGQRIGPGGYVDAIIDGFTQVYDLVRANRDALLASGGPIAAFSDAEVRVIARNTARYEQIMYDSYHPRFLIRIKDREAFLDTLWSDLEFKPILERLHRAERHDLWFGDIPAFSAIPSATSLWTSAGVEIVGAVEESPLQVVTRRIAAASPRDLALQTFLIEASLADAQSELSRRVLFVGSGNACQGRSGADPLALATAIGEHLIATSVRGNGGASWIALDETDRGHAAIGAAACDLYSGLPGIAIFLSALSRATGERRFQLLADEAVAELAGLMTRDDKGLVGCFTGLSGIVYALACHESWHHSPTMQIALDRLSPAGRFEATEEVDVISGLGGASLALLAAWRRTGARLLRDRAVEAGRALLCRASPCRTPPGPDAPGFGLGHGPVGAAVALARIGVHTGEPAFSRLALSLAEGELARIDSALRSEEEAAEPLAMSWCNGASGLLLGLIEVAGLIPTLPVARPIAALIERVLDQPEEPSDCLCHGSLGTWLILSCAAERGHVAQEKIDELRQVILARFAESGFASGTVGGMHSPGLMDGLSGIGLGLLRMNGQADLPGVLALD